MSNIGTIPFLPFPTFLAFFHTEMGITPSTKRTNWILMWNHKQIIKNCLEILKAYYILYLIAVELKSQGWGTIPCELSNYDRACCSAGLPIRLNSLENGVKVKIL